jgi:four helix bundle protein
MTIDDRPPKKTNTINPTLNMSFKFEKLDVWKLAIDMADDVHNLTRGFPKEEMFSLSSQMKRAADSISLNIAEGSTGQSDLEQVRFLGYAQRSAIEVVNCLYLAIKRNYIDQLVFDIFYIMLERLIKKIQAFKKALKNN